MEKGKYTGWGVGHNPFTREQYRNSVIKQNAGQSYTEYLAFYAKTSTRKPKRVVKRRAVKRRAVRRSTNPFNIRLF